MKLRELSADDYVSPDQAAQRLGIGRSRLAKGRMNGTGPRFARFGARTIRYRVSDLDTWAAAQTYQSTSAYAEA